MEGVAIMKRLLIALALLVAPVAFAQSAPQFRSGGDAVEAGDFEAAKPLYERDCAEGDMRACLGLAHWHRLGHQGGPDYDTANDLFDRTCREGRLGEACARLAYHYFQGQGVPVDGNKAAEYYQLACDYGDVSGCAGLGNMLMSGVRGIDRDRARGTELLRNACGRDYQWACKQLTDYGVAHMQD
jgi:TPR repeat protein